MCKSIRTGFRAKSLLIAISSITAGLTVSQALYAQAENIEEIQITGSRIRATDGMAAPTPVTTMSIGELANFDPGGTVADQLDALPQFFSTQSSARGGGALFGSAGGSFLNMRSLGANRTLVLLDGSRIVPGDKAGSVNVETLPNALIRTVDVVTGGASAAYGADALGGVTNFILDREFQGLKISAGTGITEEGDGDKYNFSIAGGREFGKLNVIASYDERFANAVNRDPADLDSDWFQRWGHVQNPAWKSSDPAGTNPQRLTLPWVSSSNSSPYGLISARGTPLDRMKFLPDGSGVTPFINGDVTSIGGTNSMSGGPEGDVWNRAFGPGGLDTAEVVGRNAFVGLQYQLTDTLTVYAQALSGRSESNQATPYGSYELESPWSATVFRDNAYLPASVAAIMDANNMTRFTLNKVGSFRGAPSIGINQRDHNVLTMQSWSVGFRTELPNGWDLSGNWQSGESEKRSQVYNKTRVDRMFLAMDAVRDPATGAIVCNVTLHNPSLADLAASPALAGKYTSRSNIAHALDPSVPLEPLYSPIGLDNTIRDCVPYNVMGSEGLTQAAIDYIGTDKFGIGNIDQDFAELLLQGEIYEGWGYGPVSLAVGFNYRDQSMTDGAHPIDVDDLGPPLNDEALGIRGFPGGYTGGSANLHMFSTVPNIQGSLDVTELFGELQAPIWESASGAQSLGGSLAFRQSDYSRSGKVDTWKIGLEFQVFEDLRVRATKSRDAREPTFRELFDAQGGGGSVNDPTMGNKSVQITTTSGGNPDLSPEIGDTVVAGLVYQPSWLDGLSVSADWYQVEVSDSIAQLNNQRIVDECYINNVTELCGNIERGGANNDIIRVFNYFLNLAQARVEGVDLELAYRMEPDLFDSEQESLSVRALAGYLIERADTPFGGTPLDVAGAYTTPEWTSNATANYGIGPLSLQLQMRYIDSGLYNVRWVEGVDVDDNEIPSHTWFNGQIAYNGETNNGANWTVALNVQNLFDRNPVVIPGFSSRGGAQTISDNYDTLGRRYQLSVNYNF